MLVIHTHTPSHAIDIEVCQCVIIIAQVCLISTCTNKSSYTVQYTNTGVKSIYIVLILYIRRWICTDNKQILNKQTSKQILITLMHVSMGSSTRRK